MTFWPSDLSQSRIGAVENADVRRKVRHQRLRNGVWGELLAVGALLVRGYRIIGRRVRSKLGEIDIIAVKGRRLAFVEVKFRETIELAEAAITDRQIDRIAAAAESWTWRHKAYRNHEIGLDAILVAPGCWPRFIPNALQPVG
jgi:putative endonuclease